MPNPQNLEPTYNYLNADIGALSALLGGLATGENFEFQTFAMVGPNPNVQANYSANKKVFRFAITAEFTYVFSGNEVITIYQQTTAGQTQLFEGKLTSLMDTGQIGSGVKSKLAYLSDIINIAPDCPTNLINIAISNVVPGNTLQVTFATSANPFYNTAGIKNRTQQGYNTYAHYLEAATGLNLQNLLNSHYQNNFKDGVIINTSCFYSSAADPLPYKAIITYLK